MTSNKYNVRAVRHELDNFIRYNHWTKFRSRFTALDEALRNAVCLYRPKHTSCRSLLHYLCSSSSTLPLDVLESVIQTCPKQLIESSPTPLSLALDRQASRAVIECLVRSDTTQQSLYATNIKGLTPLLQAVRQSNRDAIVRMLVEHDATGRSLLISTPKRNHVPLYYVANEEFKYSALDDDDSSVLPEELEYMLLQTHRVFEMQQGNKNVVAVETGKREEEDQSSLQEDETGFLKTSHSANDPLESNDYYVLALQATIACAHLLGDKNTAKLVRFLTNKVDEWEHAGQAGNSLLHHVCRATHVFMEPIAGLADCEGKDCSLLDFLIWQAPQALLIPNCQGELALHVALQTAKTPEFLHKLLAAAPESIQIPSNGRLPLHLATAHYRYEEDNNAMMQELFQMYPTGAAIPDGLMRLFAFQLASLPRPKQMKKASSKTNNKKDPSKNKNNSKEVLTTTATEKDGRSIAETEELLQLDTIFSLLRASPQVIESHII